MILKIESPKYIGSVDGPYDVITHAEPSKFKFMLGWTFEKVQVYCQKNGWASEVIFDDGAK